jgi:hypothetical protein
MNTLTVSFCFLWMIIAVMAAVEGIQHQQDGHVEFLKQRLTGVLNRASFTLEASESYFNEFQE